VLLRTWLLNLLFKEGIIMSLYYTANANRLTVNTNGYKMLEYIVMNDGATKYELVTNVLGKTGTKKSLRGYYSCYMRGWVDSGIVEYDKTNFKYYITRLGMNRMLSAIVDEANFGFDN
jgi:hypothetical protein